MGPIVEAAQADYAGKVEFRVYDISNPSKAEAEVELFQQLGGTGVPEFYFVSASGELSDKVIGSMSEQDFRAILDSLR